MKVALDTNRYVDLCNGMKATAGIVSRAEAVFLPFAVVAELRAGFAVGRKGLENEKVLRRFLLKPGVQILFTDDQTTHHYASVFRQLRIKGTPIPTNDIWICALILQYNLILHARDKHFDNVPQISRI